MKKLLIVDVPESVCLLPIDFMSIEVDEWDYFPSNVIAFCELPEPYKPE
jgi:hypothetical protein